MFKQFAYLITRVGELWELRTAQRLIRNSIPVSKQLGLPEIHSDDFKPELKQDFNFEDIYFNLYVPRNDLPSVRVYMPLRKTSNIETNTKYLESIINIVSKYVDVEQGKTVDFSEISFADLKPNLSDCISELSTKIFLTEHKNRYQIEQPQRHQAGLKKFESYLYTLKTSSIEQFILDYNNFLLKSIKKSHGGINYKIPLNLNIDADYSSSPLDGRIFHLYYQDCKIKKYVANVLAAAHPQVNLKGFNKRALI